VTPIDRLVVVVVGRPAPQGSKHHGVAGQMREASAYLPPWRAAVKLAAVRVMKELGVAPDDRPVFRGAVGLSVCFRLHTGQRIDGPPDLDKLVRGVCDALTLARVWEDDARVVYLNASKTTVENPSWAGARIVINQMYVHEFAGAAAIPK
jgi:Holliday junction resolvase RusA-like endonuclease